MEAIAHHSLRIALFGPHTPHVAKTALALHQAGFTVVGIIAPTPLAHASRRHRVLHAIERLWRSHFEYPTFETVTRSIPGCEIRIVTSHNDPEVATWLRAVHVDIGLLLGTKIIKPHILESVRLGFLNAHSALLPKYRGTKSEVWILLDKAYEYLGVSIHWVTPGLDQGNVILQKPLHFTWGDTPESLRRRALDLHPQLFVEALTRIASGTGTGTPQDESQATKYPRPTTNDYARLRELYPYIK